MVANGLESVRVGFGAADVTMEDAKLDAGANVAVGARSSVDEVVMLSESGGSCAAVVAVGLTVAVAVKVDVEVVLVVMVVVSLEARLLATLSAVSISSSGMGLLISSHPFSMMPKKVSSASRRSSLQW